MEPSRASAALSTVFCLSGATALLFETLWFRQAGLAIGNSVWATAIVLASFMAGLALGSALSARHGQRISRPIRAYAALEVAVTLSGVALVFWLPDFGTLLAPLFRPFLDQALPLNGLRLLICFTLLLIPSTAMGATLPLLVKALHGSGSDFGVVLGRLYGFNTLGAVGGALIGESFAIEQFGIRGTGILAGGMGLAAAAAALSLDRLRQPVPAVLSGARPGPGLSGPARRLLAAAFISGGLLLALEVVWFRFLSMRALGTGLVQATLLATILLGIAAGGLVASRWLRADPDAVRFLPAIALVAGALTVATYAAFHQGDRRELLPLWTGFRGIALPGARLMLPVSFASGLLFTLLGHGARREIASEVRAAGLLTMWNTLGAALGSLVAGFVLLPGLGMERSLFGLAAAYGLVALLASRLPGGPSRQPASRREFAIWTGSLALYGAHVVLFPFGLMERHYFRALVERWEGDGARLVALREGVDQTIAYLRRDFSGLGVPDYYRLVTDGFSMSGSAMFGERYMKLFVYWPVAVHPGPRQALLISYGVGMTAQALTDTAELERIDVVDTSRDILEMSQVVFPDPASHPLLDPRVTVHIEDGRQFLQTTDRRYDIITGEPPPLKLKGVVSLYTRDYFTLMRSRLAPGGIVTYWLPPNGLSAQGSYSIIRGFCDVFPDCSLWVGDGLNWMLAGTNGGGGPVSKERFKAQWEDPVTGAALRRIGVETPEQLGSLFLADAGALGRITRDAPPLTDDFPARLGPVDDPPTVREEARKHRALMDTARNRAGFEQSPLIARFWPDAVRSGASAYFETRSALDEQRFWLPPATAGLSELRDVLTRTSLRTLPLWMLGTSPRRQAAVAEALERGESIDRAYWTGLEALVDRSYAAAAAAFEQESLDHPENVPAVQMRVLALALAGQTEEVRALIDHALQGDVHGPYRAWLAENVLRTDPR